MESDINLPLKECVNKYEIKTKLDIVSGFLGAGKTTFIQKLICDVYQGQNVVVLENEFGKISLDGETLQRQGIMVESICAGCICCTSAGELSRNIVAMVEKYRPCRIIVEPTGIAKLSDIRNLLAEQNVSDVCTIDHVVTIVDARNYEKRMMISKEFFEDQIKSSEVIFLSKTENLSADQSREITTLVKKINPSCTVIAQPWRQITADLLIDYISCKPKELPQETYHDHDHLEGHRHTDGSFDSFSFESDCLTQQDNIEFILNNMAQGVYGEIHRAKGVFQDSLACWFDFEYVPGETRITSIEQYLPCISKKLQICIIGTKLNKNLLKELFH